MRKRPWCGRSVGLFAHNAVGEVPGPGRRLCWGREPRAGGSLAPPCAHGSSAGPSPVGKADRLAGPRGRRAGRRGLLQLVPVWREPLRLDGRGLLLTLGFGSAAGLLGPEDT